MSNPLIARFAGEPALIDPNAVDRFKACLMAVMANPHAQAMLNERAQDDGFWPEPGSWKHAYRPYIVVDGVLQIPVKGVLLNDFPFAVGSWATGYEYIQRAFERGIEDGSVRAIALVCDSPGGMVAGNFDLVDRMYALRTEKPVRAFAHESAYSAAYSIASVGHHIAVSRTGGVGSIGVVTAHIDISKALDEAGVKVTFIHAGKHKVDGNPYEPLPADVKARIQARIDELYAVFVSTVARNRPQLSEEEIRATEALTFTATQAVSNRLADSIGSLDDALAAFAADLSSTDGDEDMSTQDKAAEQAAIDAAVTAAKTEAATEKATAVAEATKAGEQAAVTRINAILASDAGKARPKAALSAALKTAMTVEEATAFLADLPEEKAEAKPDAEAEGVDFEAAMKRDNPDVGAESGKKDDDPAKDDGSDIRDLAARVGLKGFTAKAAA